MSSSKRENKKLLIQFIQFNLKLLLNNKNYFNTLIFDLRVNIAKIKFNTIQVVRS